ncbi:hypothetical protein AWC38_SpisGene22013 [Stylophora pistillata]|uniref:CCHC-type domain-containing protein n=1 Tax=Stylophora pistillata TaxID=50429 RepID=A0A2B4RC49_STYPI|nr:hypothetical protein AWC38_SpisGene22013 [Stylophora pistillata]
MENCGTLEDLKSKRKSYDEVWHKFVNTHEQYLECLELLCYEQELVKARVSYDAQMSRKLTFDNVIESWVKKSKLESKEYEKEFMEARMEEKRAAVSLDVYKQAEVENECCNVDNLDILSMELESSAIQGTELCYSNKEPYRSDEKAYVVVQPIPFECTPVQVRVPSEQLPPSGNVSCGQKKDNPDNSRGLQLLIQHYYGKAREAIESCVNLPVEEGYYAAKNTSRENFGKPHIIAKANIKKLENLPLLKQADGQSLVEFSRHLEVAERTLTGMGPEYASDLNHTNTLGELNRKPPLFMRVKWTECAGRMIESGQRPRFGDFLQFLRQRASLMNNEFGEALNCSPSRDKEKGKGRDGRNPTPHKFTTMAIGLPYPDKMKIAQENSLCIKCLNGGHYARICPKTNFKCQKEGCNKEHNTLLHPPPSEPDNGSTSQSQPSRESLRLNASDGSNFETSNQDRVNVTAATGAGERVRLSVVPLKVQIKGSDLPPVETYALLDSGSTVTLCHEHLPKKLGVSGPRLNFTLSGMTGSTRVESQLLDIVVTSMDEIVFVDLPNVRTVKQMPISIHCIVKKGDITRWSHLCDIKLQELEVEEVMLVIGLKERPSLFLPQEYKAGGEDERVAVRYSLGWTVIGPVHDQKDDSNCSANFTRTIESSTVYDNVPVLRDEHNSVGIVAAIEAMFHQVLVDPKDPDSLRFLSWPNEDLTKEIKEYPMVKHLFGATSSPSVANFYLRKTAQSYQENFYKKVIETLNRNMYVDDMMKSTSTTGKAISLASQLRTLLEKGGFRLTKWYRNDREVMAIIPGSERAKSVANLKLEGLPTERALGLKWNIEEDKFVMEVMEKMLQRGSGEVKEEQLHLFSDTSRQGYAANAYLRLKDVTNQVHCVFVMGTARLAPIQWRYVNQDDNLADDDSKGLKIDTMLRDDRCLKGPKYLWEDKSHCPNMIKVPVLGDDDEEVRKEAQIYVSAVQKLQIAESEIFKRFQQVALPEVIDVLSTTGCCEEKRYSKKVLKKAGAPIRQLNPQTKEGLLRVGGRLVNAPFGDERKHPIILPYKHHTTYLIMKPCHEKLGHMGQESVLSSSRETAWIVKMR